MSEEAPATIESLQGVIATLQGENAALKEENTDLKSLVDELKKRLFGRSSERHALAWHPGQLFLFDELESELSQEAITEISNEFSNGDPAGEDELEEITYKRKKKRKGPQPLPDHLPKEDRIIDLPENQKICPHGHELIRVGERILEELEYVPARMRVIRYIYPTYSSKACSFHDCGKPQSAEQEPRPLDDARASTGLLAHVAVSKYCDHLPLYRQSQMFAREGIDLSRSTLCAWIMRVAVLLSPIVGEMKRRLLARSFLQADETTIRVLKSESRRKGEQAKLAYLWAYGVPWGEVVYDFALSRAGNHPVAFLEGFEGALQVDGYDGYTDVFVHGKVVRLGCFAHVRRKFHAALKTSASEAKTVLAAIQLLYRIEREIKAKNLTPEEKVLARREFALPILDNLEKLLLAYERDFRPRSDLGKAIRYTLNEWKYLKRYIDVGESEIDNNSLEHTMRPVAVGRKNYLFAGSPEGGEAAATLYSLITTCKRLGINPWEYLKDILDRVSTHPASLIGELTPRAWKEARNAQGNDAQS